ncbi:GNAT family N-acetyltransferase [Alteromonadaceae bacterium BrNp21-10]|nr:GNAT family N-acetyltransferase [Alteromonadaceae bacterium BrNp21-10]
MEFIQATALDRDYLLKLRMLTMVEHLEKSGQFLTELEQQTRLDDQYDCSYLVVHKGVIIGTLKYQQAASTIDIMQIQIHPQHQNKGYGSEIIKQILRNAQAKTLRLTVLKDNPALKLYLRLGFKVVGEDDYEYHMQIKR